MPPPSVPQPSSLPPGYLTQSVFYVYWYLSKVEEEQLRVSVVEPWQRFPINSIPLHPVQVRTERLLHTSIVGYVLSLKIIILENLQTTLSGPFRLGRGRSR